MTSEQVFKHFKGKARAAVALGIKVPSVYGWGRYPPKLRQLQVERITGGKLKAEANCEPFRAVEAA